MDIRLAPEIGFLCSRDFRRGLTDTAWAAAFGALLDGLWRIVERPCHSSPATSAGRPRTPRDSAVRRKAGSLAFARLPAPGTLRGELDAATRLGAAAASIRRERVRHWRNPLEPC